MRLRGRSTEDQHSSPSHDSPPSLFQNVPSIVGLMLIVGGGTSFLFLLLLDILPGDSHAYPILNLIPSLAVLLLGCLLFVAGGLWEWVRRRRGRLPSFSRGFEIPHGRLRRPLLTASIATVAITLAILGVGAISSELYALTETNDFCGQTCHVMHPEWTAFQESPHARLDCVQCHVGEHVEDYAVVKVAGVRRLVSTLTGRFERPVPTPIRTMRPAREICEECHWSNRLIGYRQKTRSYFLGDEENTPFQLTMLVKVGGGPALFEEGSGIHFHMLIASRVEYIARDPRRQKIRWVRLTDAEGRVTVYEDTRDPLSAEEKSQLEIRAMDCLDCHNRPAHRFESPIDAVNAALATHSIARELPYIKVQGVQALDGDYVTREQAIRGIAARLQAFYQENHPDLLKERPDLLTRSTQTLQAIYRKTMFPEMRATWAAHPDNIGHRDSPGCFRCHNDRLKSPEGRKIITRCNSCHVILAQGQDVQSIRTSADRGEPFFHPEEADYLEEYTECVDCHTGGAALYE